MKTIAPHLGFSYKRKILLASECGLEDHSCWLEKQEREKLQAKMGADARIKCSVAGDREGRAGVDSSIPIEQEEKVEAVHHSFSTPVETLTTDNLQPGSSWYRIFSYLPNSEWRINPLAVVQNGSQQCRSDNSRSPASNRSQLNSWWRKGGIAMDYSSGRCTCKTKKKITIYTIGIFKT